VDNKKGRSCWGVKKDKNAFWYSGPKGGAGSSGYERGRTPGEKGKMDLCHSGIGWKNKEQEPPFSMKNRRERDWDGQLNQCTEENKGLSEEGRK